ncbi:hypothetical protein [uncultured Microbacterium sp.]|uniref:hypothetical protein n=1 Tax=uncultured Microbacterium sp. TaxID=191216 RepID=UPI0025ED59B7|nr:hypothetical protein [uncultured Microbacterium sp.]
MKYRQITPTEAQCGAWWKSLNHYDYLHRCTLDAKHDEACTCACGALPGPRGVKHPQLSDPHFDNATVATTYPTAHTDGSLS